MSRPALSSYWGPWGDIRRGYVVQVVKQCVGTDGVEPEYVRTEVMPPFFQAFWVRRMALDRRNYRQVVETTVEIADKVRSLPRQVPQGGWGERPFR